MKLARGVLGRLLLIAGGLLVGLLLAEGLIRLKAPIPGQELFYGAPDSIPGDLFIPDPNLLIALRPGFQATLTTLDYQVPIHINRYGMRGPEPSSGRKWLAVGDSMVLGLQVPENQTFTTLLGKRLGLQVLNGGVDSYSTWQETMRYRQIDDHFPVEAVIAVFFLGNDLDDNDRFPGQAAAARGRPQPVLPPLGMGPPWKSFLARHSAIFAFGRVVKRRMMAMSGLDKNAQHHRDELRCFTRAGHGQLTHLLSRSEAALRELRDETRARGDRLVVAVAPPSFALDPRTMEATLTTFGFAPGQGDPDAPAEAVLNTLSSLEVSACDLRPALKASLRAGAPPSFRYDGHWNATGHAAVAEALATCLK